MTTRIFFICRVLQIVITMEIEYVQQLFAELNTADGIAADVQRWTPRENTSDVWNHQQDSPTNAGLGWKSNLESELPTVVIHSCEKQQINLIIPGNFCQKLTT